MLTSLPSRLCPALLLALLAGAACAQYPVKPVRMLVPNPPGGATDNLGRLIAPRLGEALGQPMLVENRPGSNGNLATESVGRAAPDGYTLLLGADAQVVISPHLYSMSIDTLKDLAAVASLVSTQMVLTAIPSLPVKTLPELIDYARRARPSLAYASIGNGSQHHLAMEMLKLRSGIDLLHIPYKGGGPATLAMLAGEVSMMFGGNSVSGQIKSGKLRLIAVAGRQRIAAYPDVATLGEFYPGLEVTPWLGIFAPGGTPAAVVARLHGEANRLLGEADMRERLANVGGLQPYITTVEEFAALVRSEHAKYGEVVKAVGVKVD